MIDKLFLSVGAMKSGTTWLYDKVRHHPAIHFSPQKEVHFFAFYYGHSNALAGKKRDRRAKQAMRLARGEKAATKTLQRLRRWRASYLSDPVDFNWFETIMDAPQANGRFLADFSNLNCFLTPDNWHDLRDKHAREIRVIYILRDPLPRIWSHFKYHLQFSKHPAAREPEKDFGLFRTVLAKGWFWRNACYSTTVQSLRAGLGTDNFSLFYFEDMIASPEQFLAELCRFLEIEPVVYHGDLHGRKNISTPAPIPPDWADYTRARLHEEMLSMRAAGIWHEKWSSLA